MPCIFLIALSEPRAALEKPNFGLCLTVQPLHSFVWGTLFLAAFTATLLRGAGAAAAATASTILRPLPERVIAITEWENAVPYYFFYLTTNCTIFNLSTCSEYTSTSSSLNASITGVFTVLHLSSLVNVDCGDF